MAEIRCIVRGLVGLIAEVRHGSARFLVYKCDTPLVDGSEEESLGQVHVLGRLQHFGRCGLTAHLLQLHKAVLHGHIVLHVILCKAVLMPRESIHEGRGATEGDPTER